MQKNLKKAINSENFREDIKKATKSTKGMSDGAKFSATQFEKLAKQMMEPQKSIYDDPFYKMPPFDLKGGKIVPYVEPEDRMSFKSGQIVTFNGELTAGTISSGTINTEYLSNGPNEAQWVDIEPMKATRREDLIYNGSDNTYYDKANGLVISPEMVETYLNSPKWDYEWQQNHYKKPENPSKTRLLELEAQNKKLQTALNIERQKSEKFRLEVEKERAVRQQVAKDLQTLLSKAGIFGELAQNSEVLDLVAEHLENMDNTAGLHEMDYREIVEIVVEQIMKPRDGLTPKELELDA